MTQPFPFSAIVEQQAMKQAMVLTAIDPGIGGVLVFGDRGTGKSTVVRALAALLPEISVVEGCPVNSAKLSDCPDWAGPRNGHMVTKPTPVVDLPLGATEDRVVGALDIERALTRGEKAFEPGLLARANRGYLYIDEVNLLEDHIVDLLLDVAQSGENVVEREGLSIRHAARFVLVGSGNPEEGELRPQLLDRFGLSVEVRSPRDIDTRVEVMRRRDAYENANEAFMAKWVPQDMALRAKILTARAHLPTLKTPNTVLHDCAALCIALGSDGLRGELTLLRAARAQAAFQGAKTVTRKHLKSIAASALSHRLRRDPLDEAGSGTRVARMVDEVLPLMDPLSPWDRVTLALTVLAIDPAGIKGLWLRARSSAVRDHVTAALPPARRLHPGIDDNALFGGIDLTATLSAGRVVTTPGLLDTPCALILTMAERAPPSLAARLARTLDDPGFSLIALDEGAEPQETLPPALTDRLGLFLDLTDIPWSETTPITLTRIAAARAALPTILTPPDAIATLTRVAHALTIDSLRAPLLALACARALAAWNGHSTVTDEDLQRATELTLAHRGDIPPTAEDAPPDQPPENPGEPQSQTQSDEIPDDILLAAARAALPADLLAKLAAGRAARAAKGSGGTGAARKGNHRGRPLPSRPGKPGSGKRIDLIATLRAAAPWQPLRRASPDHRLEIRPGDIRLKRYNETSDRLLIFAVDASGSSALARLAEAKGAVELLLAQAYARRDHVALVAFRGTQADLVLPPTRSLVQTKRRLAGLPGGGGTPLAAGLKMAFDLALQSRARGLTPTVALLTDGRGNIALDGSPNRAQAEADSLRLARTLRASGIPAMVIDIANRPQPALRQLADLLDAPYLALPRADARRLSSALSAALGD